MYYYRLGNFYFFLSCPAFSPLCSLSIQKGDRQTYGVTYRNTWVTEHFVPPPTRQRGPWGLQGIPDCLVSHIRRPQMSHSGTLFFQRGYHWSLSASLVSVPEEEYVGPPPSTAITDPLGALMKRPKENHAVKRTRYLRLVDRSFNFIFPVRSTV